ncbi:hypothetical protein P350_02100 [Burkholderia cepacia JBK9]|uniref:DUF6714 family protein n=1 Tax=Burkholderia arboris TaxID=488730 RepID=UPI000740C608|nr:DUF6714 family protein [Burkholderia arboris]ALX10412.1 hypothetical protein P350_02100 [Burkholderia cepacia JBK9]MCA8494327.1 hypothetical protein [Burkholderia arboris]
MEHHFSLFPDDIFSVEKAITNKSGIEACAVDRFFKGRRRFATTLEELRDNYECDESACLGFMEPEAFAFFLPLFMKLAACEYSASNNITDSVVYKLHRMASGDGEDWLVAIQATYTMEQLDVIVEFLKEMSRVEWQYHDPDLAAEAAIRLRKRFGR